MNWLDTIRNREDGVTAIEYALIAGIVAVALAATIPAVGTALVPIFESVAAAL
jgi:pilus assembly protein Flp/PilA